ncbi:MAG: hypothetical protein IJG16_02170 [Clostridia bacterium]|nr:hypothetical protein [Clostridia bacterium]
MYRVIENGIMSIDTRRDTFNMQDIENRRFMYNPETGVLLLGVQAPVNTYFSSHAEEHAKSGDMTHFDKFVRGWVGVGGKYKDGVIHFAPPIPHYYPSLFDKGFDALEMFNNNNANGKTVVRGFGKRWEQPLADILENHKEIKKMADKKTKQDVLYDTPSPVMTAAPPETAKAAPKKSYAEKQIEKMKELTDKLEQGVKDLLASDKYKDYLAVMSKFHNYSFRNSILIFLQKPDASMVAGYGAWQKNFKRQVKKGEHGIKIIAPSPYKTERDMPIIDQRTKQPLYGADGQPLTQRVEVTIPAYKVATVFDVSQTDGEPLPEIAAKLQSSVNNYKEFSDALIKVSPVPVEYENITSGANGYFNAEEKRIAIQSGMSELQTLKTLIHEITHAKLHNITKEELQNIPEEQRKDRHTKEVEAESVAYTVCLHYGLDTSDYSLGYVAGWSSNTELPELQNSLVTIQKTANEIICGVDNYFTELEQEQNKANEEQEQPADEEKAQPEQAETKDDFTDLPESEADEAEKLFNEVVGETAQKSEPVSKSETPAMDALEAKAMKGEPVSLMAMIDAIKADKAKAAEPKKDAAKKEKSQKPSVRKKLDAAKKQAAKQTEKAEPKKEKETAR